MHFSTCSQDENILESCRVIMEYDDVEADDGQTLFSTSSPVLGFDPVPQQAIVLESDDVIKSSCVEIPRVLPSHHHHQQHQQQRRHPSSWNHPFRRPHPSHHHNSQQRQQPPPSHVSSPSPLPRSLQTLSSEYYPKTKSQRNYYHYDDEIIPVQEDTSTIKMGRDEVGQDPPTTFLYDPYNPLNISIQEQEIQQLFQRYGLPPNLPIHNMKIYQRAFIHRSYVKHPATENQHNNIMVVPPAPDCLPLSTKSNERLEFLGDGILEFITKYYLYRRFPRENEGFMTEKKIALIKNEAIGKIAYEMGLHQWFVISKHAESKHTRTNLKKLGCLFESFLGAMFLDMNKITIQDEEQWFVNLFDMGPGIQLVKLFVENVFEEHVNWSELIHKDDNYKNLLQVKIQKEFKVTPDYKELTTFHPDTGFHMGVFLCLGHSFHHSKIQHALPLEQFQHLGHLHQYIQEHGKAVLILLGEGKHKIKKKAEQLACEMALNFF